MLGTRRVDLVSPLLQARHQAFGPGGAFANHAPGMWVWWCHRRVSTRHVEHQACGAAMEPHLYSCSLLCLSLTQDLTSAPPVMVFSCSEQVDLLLQ